MVSATATCFDICTSKGSGPKLSNREKTCTNNCIERFWDARQALAQAGSS